MRKLFVKAFLSLLLSVSAGGDFYAARAQERKPNATSAVLDNASVVKLVRAGFKEKTIIAIIHTRPAQFDLAPDQLVELKRSGVGENIILAMLARAEDANATASDDVVWNDDTFHDDERASLPSNKKRKGEEDGAIDIFGSNGGSSGRTRTRGSNGSSANEGQTTGSATVRILRPATETNGASTNDLKLERTPTLDNDAIIALVEAGFSEGTIIRRIENSPATFDLSPPRLAELRRKRVSQAVIAAMSAAMADDSTSRGNTPPAARQTPER
ncbi:MAG: hypothetical protein ABR577_00930 [Pyrinomonadaceae bacterium]